MNKYTITESSHDRIVLRISPSSIKELVKNWISIKSEVPADEKNAESIFNKLDTFWNDVKLRNPAWIPFKLGTGDVDEIQSEIDRLSDKAQKKEPFVQNDKDFLSALYNWIAWGGLIKWYPEASQLLRHYLNGQGQPVELNPHIYKSSKIVGYAMQEMKAIILDDIKSKGSIRGGGSFSSQGNLKDTPPRTSAEQDEKGAIVKNGTLLAEQSNPRLKNADNQFPLIAQSQIIQRQPLRIHTKWTVNSYWDYDSFDEQKTKNLDLKTHLPLPKGKILKLPDGLSQHLVELGLATEFKYNAEWDEDWSHE